MDIRKNYTLEFPLERVFSAWISKKFLVPPVTAIDIEPRVGGIFRLTTGTGGKRSVMNGRILHLEENKRLRYTWQWDGMKTHSIVDVAYSAKGSGTQVRVHHTGLESAALAEAHSQGWDSYVEGLRRIL